MDSTSETIVTKIEKKIEKFARWREFRNRRFFAKLMRVPVRTARGVETDGWKEPGWIMA